MGAADEVSYMYTLHRTNIVTNPAPCALIVIDSCKVIFNLDSTRGAGLLALAAGNTAVEADLADLCALVVA